MLLYWTVLLIAAAKVGVAASCRLPPPNAHTSVTCHYRNQEIECGRIIDEGEIVQFTCLGKTEIPPSYSDTIRCLKLGKWSHPVPRCIPAVKSSCTLPKPNSHTIVNCTLKTGEIECSKHMPIGTIVHFECVEKYTIPTNDSADVQCLENGEWDHLLPKCHPVMKKEPVTSCMLPKPTVKTTITCSLNNADIKCGPKMPLGSVVNYRCPELYNVRTNFSSMQCLENGEWNQPLNRLPRCVPVCGRPSSAVPLIANGKVIDAGTVPWHAAIYRKEDENWQLVCGGSLVSARFVLTAAHCVWQFEAKDIKVELGKKRKEDDATSQMIQVFEIELMDTYQHTTGNYNGDIALLLLKEPAKISTSISPICIDWHFRAIDKQLAEGSKGIAVGWGQTENFTPSNELRAVWLPVVSNEHCVKQQQHDFRRYVTNNTFCAGFNNGTGVCNGDSGGGLSFYDEESNIWYLQGIISLSPIKKGTHHCDLSFYSIFTKVVMFKAWILSNEGREVALELKDTMP